MTSSPRATSRPHPRPWLVLIALLLAAPFGAQTAPAQPTTPHPAQHSLALRNPAHVDTVAAASLSIGSLLHLGPASNIRLGPHRETSLEMTTSVGPFAPRPNPWEEMNAGTAALVLSVKLARWAQCKKKGIDPFTCSTRIEPERSRLYDETLYAPVGPYFQRDR